MGHPGNEANQSAILDLGRKLMAESTVSHPDRITKFVYSAKNDNAFLSAIN